MEEEILWVLESLGLLVPHGESFNIQGIVLDLIGLRLLYVKDSHFPTNRSDSSFRVSSERILLSGGRGQRYCYIVNESRSLVDLSRSVSRRLF